MKRPKHLRRWFVLAWLLIPVALVSYHFGPGQQALGWQEAEVQRQAALAAEEQGHWEQAIDAYGKALNAIPLAEANTSAAAVVRDQLRLAQLRAKFQLGKLDETILDTKGFIEHVAATHGNTSPLMFDARDFLGRVHFQAMIALRLEAADKAVWMQEWELARQNYRFLAEHSDPHRNGLDRQNLEAVIKSADLPVTAFTPPPTGGGTGQASEVTLFAPPTNSQATTRIPPPDQRQLQPLETPTEVKPPEFELGS